MVGIIFEISFIVHILVLIMFIMLSWYGWRKTKIKFL